MNRHVALVAAVVLAIATATARLAAAEQTWTGQISDSICKAKHESGAEGREAGSPAECTKACAKGGSKYVLLVGDKVYQIANQSNADLEKHAGETVKLTGSLDGDAITVSKIETSK